MVSEHAETFYTQKVDSAYGERYEDVRWHRDAIASSHYEMTKWAIERFLNTATKPETCIELGPGGGTWTRSLLQKWPQLDLELVDISDGMLQKAKKGIADYDAAVRYTKSDFNMYTSEEKRDLFFSIRAFEYVSDKKSAVARISELLKSGGEAYIITKTPHYLRARLRGRAYGSMHTGQITPKDLKILFEQEGFTHISLEPVTFTVPFFNSARLNTYIGNIFKGTSLNMINAFFSESYALKATRA